MATIQQAATQTAIANSEALYNGGNFSDIVNGDTSQLSQSAQQYLDSKTSAQANQQRQQAGEQAAASLISHGCDIDSPDCGQKATAIVCAAIATFGGPYGAAIAAVVEAIAQGINALNKLMNNQPPCSSSGNWTARQLLTYSGIAALPPTGTLANAALTMMAQGLAAEGNCKGYYNPAMVIMAALQAWNQNSQGKLVDYFVPRPKGGFGNAYIWKQFLGGSLSPQGSDTDVALPFGNNQMSLISTGISTYGLFDYAAQAPYAFQPLQNVPQKDAKGNAVADPAHEGITWIRVAGNAGPAAKLVTLSLPKAGSTPSSSTTSSTSVATKALVYTGIVAGVGAAGVGAYAMATGVSFMTALKSIFGGAVAAVNPLPVAAVGLLAEAPQSTTVQTLLLPRTRFTRDAAVRWARDHNFRAAKTDVTARYIRIRQRDPADFRSGSLRTVSFGDRGIRAVIGKLR